MEKIRQFINTVSGKITVLALLILGGALLWFQMNRSLSDGGIAAMSQRQYFVDAQTGQVFTHTLRAGETIPIQSPSGNPSGYPAELCYWTADGKPKNDPTPVLLNETIGKPGPTFCPECGRLVKMRNPSPADTNGPPPTQKEWQSRSQ